MAEEKKSESGSNLMNEILWYVIIVIPVIIILLSSFANEASAPRSGVASSTLSVATSTETSLLSPFSWFGGRDTGLKAGAIIINKAKATVRTAPAGSIVGTQDKLETGRIMEGPVEQFGTTWWRVDYPQAPDGWVDFKPLSSKIGMTRVLNIVPLLYSFYKPMGYGIAFILLILLIWFKVKMAREVGIAEKKQQLKREQYAAPQAPLAQQIADKPDVQELPGFQTEEIMPVHTMEQNARWTHIQSLISSYNPSDWRQAIIEADIILEEMLEKMQYDGTTIGDKLKSVERSDFVTLEKAWSAHKVRNQIAHGGSSFKLTREMADRTIKEYEEVFREFYYI